MDEEDAAVPRSQDGSQFAEQLEPYRAELQVHCYRMLGSLLDAEDHVQETLLRAWRNRASFEGRSSLRTWLYRIATNVCLDTLRTNPGRVIPVGDGSSPPPSEIPWLQPFPDALLDAAAPAAEEPDALVVARETIELAYLAVVQLLPANQRAVLILRDVVGLSAAETAEILDTSVASVTSALQRARATIKEHRPGEPGSWQPAAPSADELALLQRYVDAHERADLAAVVQLMRADVRFTMPPEPTLVVGSRAVGEFWADAFAAGQFRLVPIRANRQPAAANYYRHPGEPHFEAMSLDVLRIVDGQITEVTTFEPHLFRYFDLPERLTD